MQLKKLMTAGLTSSAFLACVSASAQPVPGPDVCRAHKFIVEIDGLVGSSYVNVRGMEASTRGPTVRVAPASRASATTRRTFTGIGDNEPLTLGRMVEQDDTELYDWYAASRNGQPEARNGCIALLNNRDEQCARFCFRDAVPVAYRLLPIDANIDNLPVEEIDLSVRDFQRTD